MTSSLRRIHFQKPLPKHVVLSKWRNNYSKYNNGKNESNDGIAFATVTDEKEANKSKKKKGITCFRCKEKGHYSNECTAEELPATSEKKGTNLLINKEDSSDDELQGDDDELSNLQKNSTDPDDPDDKNDSDDSSYEEDTMFSDDDYEGFAFVQDVNCNMNNKAGIPDSWILLDSQSTVDVFMNKKLLKNVLAGVAIVNKVGDLAGYGTVWYYEAGIANILSLNNVKKKYHVTYDSTASDFLKCKERMVLNAYLSHPKRGYSTQV